MNSQSHFPLDILAYFMLKYEKIKLQRAKSLVVLNVLKQFENGESAPGRTAGK